jgi:hypothetical protein
MKTQSIDTNSDIEKIQISLTREKDVSEKLRQICSLSQVAMQLSKRAIARANRNLGEDQIRFLFIKYHYGKELAQRVEKYIKKRNHEKS